MCIISRTSSRMRRVREFRSLQDQYRLSIFSLPPVAKYLTNLFESHVTISQTVTSLSAYKNAPDGVLFVVAESEGFEPSIRLHVYYLSKVALSTTLPTLQIGSLTHFSQTLNPVGCWWVGLEESRNLLLE